MGRVTWKRISEKKLPVKRRSSPVKVDIGLKADVEDWQAVVREAFDSRICPKCYGILDYFENGNVSGLRCCGCGWGFEHTHDSRSGLCHYDFSIPSKKK